MSSSTQSLPSKPIDWERGCQSDSVRNGFLIPEVVEIIEQSRPKTILDIGTATGYLPRSISSKLSYKPNWTLLDVDADRLGLAKQLWGEDSSMSAICGDLLSGCLSKSQFDAALITFTLLEMGDLRAAVTSIAECVSVNGLAIVAQPDVWRDALAVPEQDSAISSLLTGKAEIQKVDRFTRSAYPFFAVRIEVVIAEFLRHGFTLRRLTQREPHGDVTLLTFQMQRDPSLHASPS